MMNKRTTKKQFLSVCAMGENRLDLIAAFGQAVVQTACQVVNARMAQVGKHFALIGLLSGTWDAVAKMETALSNFKKKHRLDLVFKRTENPKVEGDLIPYTVEAVTHVKSNVVADLSQFFYQHEIAVTHLDVESYRARHTGLPMVAVSLTTHIPANTQLAELREQFIEYCDELNIDAILEPDKH